MPNSVVYKPSPIRAALCMLINPGMLVKKGMEQMSWPFSLLISGAAFALFFLQTGLDLMRAGEVGLMKVIFFSLVGFLYGSLIVAFIALVAFFVTKAFGNKHTLEWTIAAFGLSYSSTLVFAFIGLMFSIFFQWNTAVAFGVSGVLWALAPMIATVKEMTGGRVWVSLVVATVCGGILLFGWAILGNSL
ncbi:MAG: hypothetical protein WCP79_15405 [Bacillota bacterium]